MFVTHVRVIESGCVTVVKVIVSVCNSCECYGKWLCHYGESYG